VAIRIEDEELVVPESPPWDRVSVDEDHPAAHDPVPSPPRLIGSPVVSEDTDPNDLVVDHVDYYFRDGHGNRPAICLREGMLVPIEEGNVTMLVGSAEENSDVDVALGEAMPGGGRTVEIEEVRDFGAEEEAQMREAYQEANAEADRLVRNGRAPIPYEEDGGSDALPEGTYNTPPEYSESE